MKQVLTLTIALLCPPLLAQSVLPDYYGESCKGSIGFWENRGQIKNELGQPMGDVKYYSQGAYPRAYFLKDSRFSLVLQQPTGLLPSDSVLSHRLDIRPYDAAFVNPVGNVVKTHYQNYYLPWCGPNGIDHVYGYDYVQYPSVYTNVDMVFYSGSAGQKLAFYCWPGSDPNKIKLQFFGQDSLQLDIAGYLKIYKEGQWIKLDEAIAYQVDANNEVIQLDWNAQYEEIESANIVSLGFENYNPELPLVLQIGPTPAPQQTPTDGLCWGSYYGGSAPDQIYDTETDSEGNSYLTGSTESDFITFQGNVGSTYITVQGSCALLTSFSSEHELKWTVYYGGTGDQIAYAIAVKDQPTKVYIGGYTFTPDMFPWFQTGAYNNQNGVGNLTNAGFIGKFNNLGIIEWSTYFGDKDEAIHGMDFDSQGRLHIVGRCSGTFPEQPLSGATSWPAGNGLRDILFARFSTQDGLDWCTSYGGSGLDVGEDVVCHETGFYVSGSTTSTNLVLIDGGSSAYDQTSNAGDKDNVILGFTSGASCNWATYFGGNGIDEPGYNSLACRTNGDLFLAGKTQSTNLPYQSMGGYINSVGSTDGCGYIVKFKGSNRAKEWCTYLGGGPRTGIESLELANDHLFAVGFTSDPDLPIVPVGGVYDQPSLVGADNVGSDNGRDGLVVAFDASTSWVYSSFYGGPQGGRGESIRSASFSAGELFISGITSKGFPLDQSFPLYFPGDPAYYDDQYEVALFNYTDLFVAVLCTQAITGGPVGFSEQLLGNNNLTAIPLGDDRWVVRGVASGRQTIRVCDAAGRVVQEELINVPPSGATYIDFAKLASGMYTISVSNMAEISALKLMITR